MAEDINSVTLSGKLGRDVELRVTPNGTAVANLNLAVNSGYGDKKKTSWFKVVVFGKQAETIANQFKKGDAIVVNGTIEINEFTGKDGNKKSSTDIVLSKFFFFGSKSESKTKASEWVEESDDIEIPF